MFRFDERFYSDSWTRYESTYVASNEVLYRMCREHSDHSDLQWVLAKVSIIDLVYGTNMARYRASAVDLARHLYSEARAVNSIFRGIESIELSDKSFAHKILEVIVMHGQFTDLIRSCTATNEPVFASKYLHFHFPSLVPILDSRAEHAVKQHVECRGGNFLRIRSDLERSKTNKRYLDFCDKFVDLVKIVRENPKNDLLVKKIDQYLYQYQKGYDSSKRPIDLKVNYL